MKFKYLVLFGFSFLLTPNYLFCQIEFNWSDSVFHIGQKKIVKLHLANDGICSTMPCYNYLNNSQVYDNIISLLNNHQLSLAFIWHTSTEGSSTFNFYQSEKVAKNMIEILIKRGINVKRICAIGLGESFPLISENQLNITNKEDKFKYDKINNRVEIIITSVK